MSQNEPKINPATGYVHYEEPEHVVSVPTPVEDVAEDDPAVEPEAQEASE